MIELMNTVDANELRACAASAQPFPFFVIDNFLREDFADDVLDAFPSYAETASVGKTFKTVNERGKYQISKSTEFPKPIRRLHEMLASADFTDFLSEIMSIPNLLADEEMVGGGIHQTGPRGILDVHVDFNYLKSRQLHRRLNILIYFNKDWDSQWGGNIELWDEDVKACHHSLGPIFNRCVVFETSEISYHGVTAVSCPEQMSRKSFAAYYYTKEAPPHWTGESHSTVFIARPDEKLKKSLLMPAERLLRLTRTGLRRLKSGIRERGFASSKGTKRSSK